MTMGIHSREIYNRIMSPALRTGIIECWHIPHQHRIDYGASKGRIMTCRTCGEPFTERFDCDCGMPVKPEPKHGV